MEVSEDMRGVIDGVHSGGAPTCESEVADEVQHGCVACERGTVASGVTVHVDEASACWN